VKRKYKKIREKSIKTSEEKSKKSTVLENSDKEISESSQDKNFSPWRLFFFSIVLIVFFSSSVVVFFNSNSRENIIFNESKKYVINRLKKEGPSPEIYQLISELYKERDKDLYYFYLKQAYSLVKKSEVYKYRDLIANLLEESTKRNENIDRILEYSLALYRTTKISNPSYFQILSSILEIYDSMLKINESIRTLESLEEVYKENLQIKIMLANEYYKVAEYQKAKEKVDYILEAKKTKKLPLSFEDVSFYYLINKQLKNLNFNKLSKMALSLTYQEMNNFLVFLISDESLSYQEYKKVVNGIIIYRPEVREMVNKNPFINLAIGKRFYESRNALYEVYFRNAVIFSDENTKNLINAYIYQIISKAGTNDKAKVIPQKKSLYDVERKDLTDILKKVR